MMMNFGNVMKWNAIEGRNLMSLHSTGEMTALTWDSSLHSESFISLQIVNFRSERQSMENEIDFDIYFLIPEPI